MCELAAARKRTSLEQQRELLDPARIARDRADYEDAVYRVERFRRLLDAVVDMPDYQPADNSRQGRGFAVYDMSYVPGYQNSCIAIALDVTLGEDERVRVNQVWAAVECGKVVNPNIVKAQISGGIIFGLSNALFAKITLANGRVEQSNFHDYPILSMVEAPPVEVAIIASDENPTGVGEGSTPVVIGALVDAIHAAGGRHPRSLPLNANTRA